MPNRIDHLGLRSAMADRLLPMLVGAMSFLAVLAIAGVMAAAALAAQWQGDTGAALTVQVPNPAATAATAAATGALSRENAVLGVLATTPGITNPKALTSDQLNTLLKPWLGEDAQNLALPIPAVITATWSGIGSIASLRAALDEAAPGTLAETGQRWAARVAALTASLQDSAAAILVIVALVASAVVAIATHAGLAQRRDTIAIIHGLGALDSDIAARFALRTTLLAAYGATLGAALAVPVLLWLATLAAPFSGVLTQAGTPPLPILLWATLPLIPIAAALIGWVTTQFTVRGWLRGLA